MPGRDKPGQARRDAEKDMRAVGFATGPCTHPEESLEYIYEINPGKAWGTEHVTKTCGVCFKSWRWINPGHRHVTTFDEKEPAAVAVEEIRAGVARASEKCNTSVAALQQAGQSLEEAQRIIEQVTSGSTQQEVAQALGLLAEATQGISGQQSTIQAAVASAQSYSARL